ncbi:biopolymer transporter ExbD [uncultured Marinobacter sp.]|uniref:ExbD/TolR family protein n=1 Tax=uncultured Marinobacter sp. TaxID=187379 RepID=UPI0032B2CDB9
MKPRNRPRRLRRQSDHRRAAGGLNLVSLMDIFTLLVFFLMVNSSDVKVLENRAGIPLPNAVAGQPAAEALTVELEGRSVRLQGREVDRLTESEEGPLAGLSEALLRQRAGVAVVPATGLAITVLAARDTDYRVLRRILSTCIDADFRQVRLAVEPEVDHG